MEVADLFDGLLENLKVNNRTAIAKRRDEITRSLNTEFRSIDDSARNQLMVGSYGRGTAIRGISDLDMLYILPASIRDSYTGETGPQNILRRTRQAILARYPDADVRVDQCVVVVQFENFKFEVQPAFENEDKSFSYPDTYAKAWKVTKPRAEIDTIRKFDHHARGNLRNLCRMVRAWKNAHGIAMGGLLIDTLAYNFFQSTTYYNDVSTVHYDFMARDFFKFLSDEPDHEYYAALGSRQRVRVPKRFQGKAGQAYNLCLEAIKAEDQPTINEKWKAVFGRSVPAATADKDSQAIQFYRKTEEFIEDKYPVDIRYELHIDCLVTLNGWRPSWLRRMILERVPLRPQKTLDFSIQACDVPEPFVIRWKVLNRGPEAIRRDMIRGQITEPNRGEGRREHTDFRGDHHVECYIIKDGVVVARDQILVPIRPE